MSVVKRNYPRMLAVINTRDCVPNPPNERKLCGDIIGCTPLQRNDHGTMGTKQGTQYLMLHLEGLTRREMGWLALANTVPFNPTGDSVRYDKQRYCIPFERLKKVYPAFDIDQAKDQTLVYQPFVLVQGDPPYFFLQRPHVFDVHGLVFDKVTGGYL